MTQAEVFSQWQAQDTNAPRISLDYLRFRVRELAREGKRRRIVRYLFVAVYFYLISQMAWIGKYWLTGFGFCLGAAGIVYSWKRGIRSFVEPKFQGGLDALTFYRTELERRRDFSKKRESWPAILNFSIWMSAMLAVERLEFPKLSTAMLVAQAMFIVVALSIGLIENRRELNRLQREIDALESLAK